MTDRELIEKIANELPSHHADRLEQYYTKSVNQEYKKRIDNFLLPLK
jgi:hypothetical protein